METALETQWFGDERYEQSRRAAARSLAAVAARVVTAKPFPGVAARVRTLADSPDASVVRVARVLEGDAAMCARLLRVVNSAGYGLRVKCSSVRHAVALAGLDNVRNLVTSASVLELFDPSTKQAAQLMNHCAQTGLLSRYLGAYLSLPKELLFTCGFMHDIGKLMLLEVQEEEYKSLLENTAGECDAAHPAEKIAFGFDHAVLGAAVLRKWHIPDPVPAVVEQHHDFISAQQAGGELAQSVAVIRLAGAIAHDLEAGRAEPGEATRDSAAADYLGISPHQLTAMWSDFDALCNRTRKLFEKNEPEWLECQSLVPRKPTDPPPKPADAEGDEGQIPVTYPCHVCGTASYGETCPVCHAYVCPEHGGAREGWCEECAGEYEITQRRARRSLPVRIGATMAAAAVLAAVVGLAAGWPSRVEAWVGVGLLVLLSGVFSGAFHQFRARVKFLRRGSSAPEPEPALLPVQAPWPKTVISFRDEG